MYTIDGEKLMAVTEIVNLRIDPRATEELVQAQICADWLGDGDVRPSAGSDGQGHQAWIDAASAEEIASWIGSFYGDEN